MIAPYPFSALVGADDLQLALLLNAVSPAVGGVLVRGEKGTAKSTAVRGLAALLPPVAVVAGCPFTCDPAAPDPTCPAGPHAQVELELRPARLVELPVGASEDRLAGSLDLERALVEGRRAFEPGLLARAHRGVLSIDEVNLLGDHLVDLLLDAAAMGVNHVEREGVSVRHAARFQLVGTMNPEEGELRPQLLDRFGLSVEVRAPRDVGERAEVVRRRLAYEADPEGFAARWGAADDAVAERIRAARALLPRVVLGEAALRAVVAACTAFEVDGLRADLVTAKAATALAAWSGRIAVTVADVRAAALLALPHRRRRQPFDTPGLDEDRLDEALADATDDPGPNGDGPDGAPGDGHGADGAGEPAPADTPVGDDRADQAARAHHQDGDAAGRRPGDRDGRPGDRDRDGRAGERDRRAGERDRSGRRSDGPGAGNRDGAGDRDLAGDPGDGGGAVLPVGMAFDPLLLQVAAGREGPSGRRSPARTPRGRHVGARAPEGRAGDLAVGATLRAAAPRQAERGRSGPGLVLRAGDLRVKVREGRVANLVLFVVDASGSMAARRRMTAVKGAVQSLLLDAYRRRDRVGLVTFRGQDAAVTLPPTSSVDLAARRLADLPTGGRTPLAAGLRRAGALLDAEAVRDPSRRPLLVLLTDGRVTTGPDPLPEAAALAARGIAAVVVDTEEGHVRLGLAGGVAAGLAAPCLRLEQLQAGALAGVVRTVTTARAA